MFIPNLFFKLSLIRRDMSKKYNTNNKKSIILNALIEFSILRMAAQLQILVPGISTGMFRHYLFPVMF